MRRRETSGINIALLDILTGALGAVIILYVAVPKGIDKEPVKVDVSKKVENLLEIKKLKKERKELAESLVSQQEKSLELQATVLENEKTISELKKKVANLKVPDKSERDYRGKGLPVDVGFKFKGKRILFLIDVSGSMVREDRIGQVKAGLKMLITSMPTDYYLDVVQFPGKFKKNYKALWGGLKKLEVYEKNSIYKFLLRLRARGYTPTHEALTYAFEDYQDLSDIVLLTDGAPTLGNTSKTISISKILLDIQKRNKEKKIRINTIGVGSSFVKNKGSKAYVFLEELAKDHGGFFYGF